MNDMALRQKLRKAEDRAEDAERRAFHAEASLNLATIRMQQAEQTMRGMVADWCECISCSKRRSV